MYCLSEANRLRGGIGPVNIFPNGESLALHLRSERSVVVGTTAEYVLSFNRQVVGVGVRVRGCGGGSGVRNHEKK